MPIAKDIAFALGLLALLVGLVLHPFDWPALAPRLQDTLSLMLLAAGIAALVAWRTRLRAATAVLVVVAPFVSVAFAGLAGTAATALLLLGGAAIGSLLPAVAGTSPLLRLLAGLGLLAGAAGWLLPFPLHHAAVWGPVLAALVAWRRRAMVADLRAIRDEFSAAVEASPRLAFLVATIVVVAGAPAWLPVRMADDLAYHLGLGWELMQFGHARFDLAAQVWSLAPWSTDVLHALVMVLAGRETIGALNLFWLLAAAWLAQGLARQLGVAPRLAWWVAAAYATLPMSSMLSGSMQVESATPAVLAAVASLLAARPAPSSAALWLLAALAGTLLGMKLSMGVFLLPMAVWWLVQWRGRMPWRALPFGLLLGLLAGGSSYAYAAGLAGNPVLPLFNGTFLSPWFRPEDFVDPTWTQGLSWDLPWQWTFHAGRFHEAGADGAAGVVLLALLGGAAIAVSERGTRALALATLAGCALMLVQIQYQRYLQPAMPLLLAVCVAGVSTRTPRGREALLAGLVALQLALLPTAAWQLMQRSLRVLVKEGPDAVLMRVAPERILARFFRDNAKPGAFVLFSSKSNASTAELPGRAAAVSWHSPPVWDIRLADFDWLAMFETSGATHVIARDLGNEPGLAEALQARGAVAVASAGPATLYRLAPAWTPMTVQAPENGPARASLPLDPRYPVVGDVRLRIGCGRPGMPVSLHWQLQRGGGRGPHDRWMAPACDARGQLEIEVHFAALPSDGDLQVTVQPAQPGDRDPVRLLGAEADLRRDLGAQGERFHAVWDALCARPGCGRDRDALIVDRWQPQGP